MNTPLPQKRAFTLVELVVVLTMAAILVVVSIGGITGAQKHARVNSATTDVLGLIQDARSRALSNIEMDLGAAGTCTANSYYIAFGSELYLYASFTSDCSESEELLETITLDDDIEISSNISIISYAAPMGEATITIIDPAEDSVITVSSVDGQFSQTIAVNEISGVPELL